MTGLHDDKRTDEASTLFLGKPPDCLNQGLASIAGEAEQNDTS